MQNERVTIAKTLDAVNQRFYQHHGNGFDRTRQAAWPGWLDVFEGTLSPPFNQVLDIGCGNGRFASFLAAHEHLSRQIKSYVGYDRDQGLLESARRKTLPFATKWQTWDWMQSKSSTELIKSDLIVAFGVFHHIFGYEHRLQLLTRLTKSLLPNGHLVLSVWDFGKDKKYHAKQLDKAAICQTLDINPDALESNDFFFGFGHTHPIPRYCHWSSPNEMQRTNTDLLRSVAGLKRIPYLNCPTDLNQYWIWSRA